MYKNLVGRPGAVLAAVCVAQFMVSLDVAVVNVALPSVRSALGFAPLDLSWVVHVYALTFGGFLLLGGRLCDAWGRRLPFTGGLLVFGLASLAGGLAAHPWQLIAARAVQGAAGAALAPAALSALTDAFPPGPGRVRALGAWSGVTGAGGAFGVLLGGLLTEYAGWRWVMLVNVPVAALALVLGLLALDRREPRGPGRPAGGASRIDLPGAVLVTGGLGLFVLGVVRTDRAGWGSATTLVTLAAAVVLLVLFVVAERRSPAPLLRLGLLRSRWVAGANGFVLLAAAAQFSAFYFVSLHLQQVLGLGAAATGLGFLPFSGGMVAGTVLATRLATGRSRPPRSVRLTLGGGGLLAAAGLGWFALLSPSGSYATDVLGPSLVTSLGLGLCFAPAASAATTGIAPHETGTASGLFNSARQLGGCLGLAALATLAAARTGSGTGPRALDQGYALGLAVSAALLLVAAVLALAVLPAACTASPETPDREASRALHHRRSSHAPEAPDPRVHP
ncbi:MFS transporter [Streptomyces sp. NPDC049954]|uniref:MFS transporter n=1 Tax=Streptomyces sp. NPDC049954 TaxID=3155779 RepID=UPI00344815CD